MNTKDFNKVNKREKGITLIALVITIIVLLILAAVSIAMLTGENGILKKASTSREKTEINSADEEIKLVISELKAEKQLTNVNTNEFLASKVPDSLDDYEKIDAEYELERKGYSLVINEDGDIIGKIQKSGTRPKIENIKITSVEGTEIENNSQEIGTKLKISFKVYIEGGKIDKVTPSDTLKDGEVTYTTNGTDTEISFTVIGNIDNKECKRTKTISIKDKYVVYKDSLLEAVEEAEQSDANASIRVLGENNEIVKYNFLSSGISAAGWNFSRVFDMNTKMIPDIFVEVGDYFNTLPYDNYKMYTCYNFNTDGGMGTSDGGFEMSTNRLHVSNSDGFKKFNDKDFSKLNSFCMSGDLTYTEVHDILKKENIQYILVFNKNAADILECDGDSLVLSNEQNLNPYYLLKVNY